ncbi:similar to splicing factor, arginine/serine-rich 2, isoform CRA_b [Rattus norvegicus]|uniref:Similar to splicing factor, arginine/serine-rich 2, isoform CRA_b n=1 Tax=Rattus norvegicus TaxID=10116 RepID=A6HKZ7_RAT|nr:similar to splicing factor, arginine/serine-rich 2, isoform CRA_b [Rattus norvegicus]EDM06705.1 similar to splicing factor, arginine/serine-rich 2, isoform CRA_b [Rattus norvegicus]
MINTPPFPQKKKAQNGKSDTCVVNLKKKQKMLRKQMVCNFVST